MFNLHASNSNPYQEEKQRAEGQEVTVTLKLVQIYVTDKKDNPITDLKKSDFALYDNGKLQKIADFERHILPLPSSKTETQQIKTELPPSKMLSRKFFLFFDFAFNNIGGIAMAKKASLHFIDTQIIPTDEVGVLSYSTNKGLVLHEHLTTDHEKIREVLQKVGSREALGRAGRLLDAIENDISRGGETAGGPFAAAAAGLEGQRQQVKEAFERTGGLELKYQARHFPAAIKDLAEALRYIPGYKHIIFFSTGVPSYVVYPHSSTIKPELDKVNLAATDALDMRNRYESMNRELKSANSPVYTVNVEGLYADFMERKEIEPIFSQVQAREFKPLFGIDDRNRRGETTLRNMAKMSGGKYFGNINEYEKVIEEIQSLTGSYYVLAYYIDDKWDGKYHKIEAKVKRKGLKVFGQRGYFNPKPFTEYSELEKKIQLVDLALNERSHFGVPVQLPLSTLPFSDKGETKVMMLTRIISEKMKEVAGKKTEIIFLVFDEKKNIVRYQRFEPEDPRFSQEDFFCYALSSLTPGRYECRMVMRNLESGKGAVASSMAIIPETPGLGLKLYPPLLLTPNKSMFYMEVAAAAQKEDGEVQSVLFSLYPFDSTQYAPLIGTLKKGNPNVLAKVRCTAFSIPSPEVILSARLVYQSTGKTIPLDFHYDYESFWNTFISSVEFQTNELLPGRYILYLFAEEKNTQSKSHVHSTFIVEQE